MLPMEWNINGLYLHIIKYAIYIYGYQVKNGKTKPSSYIYSDMTNT